MDIKVEKRRFDAIMGILRSPKRRFTEDEREALEDATMRLALVIADNLDGETTKIVGHYKRDLTAAETDGEIVEVPARPAVENPSGPDPRARQDR